MRLAKATKREAMLEKRKDPARKAVETSTPKQIDLPVLFVRDDNERYY